MAAEEAEKEDSIATTNGNITGEEAPSPSQQAQAQAQAQEVVQHLEIMSTPLTPQQRAPDGIAAVVRTSSSGSAPGRKTKKTSGGTVGARRRRSLDFTSTGFLAPPTPSALVTTTPRDHHADAAQSSSSYVLMTPSTAKGTRRKLSTKLMSKVSVFEHTTTTMDPMAAAVGDPTSFLSPTPTGTPTVLKGGEEYAVGMPDAVPLTAPRTPSSLLSSSSHHKPRNRDKDSKANQLIQQFNEGKAGKSPKAATVNDNVPSSSSKIKPDEIMHITPRQVKQMVTRLSSGAAHSPKRASSSSSSSGITGIKIPYTPSSNEEGHDSTASPHQVKEMVTRISTSSSHSNVLSPKPKSNTSKEVFHSPRQVQQMVTRLSGSSHGSTTSSPGPLRLSSSHHDGSTGSSTASPGPLRVSSHHGRFAGVLPSLDVDEFGEDSSSPSRRRPRRPPDLLKPEEVKALIQARAKSEVFQKLVTTYEHKSHKRHDSNNNTVNMEDEKDEDGVLLSPAADGGSRVQKRKWKANKQSAKARLRDFVKQQIQQQIIPTNQVVHEKIPPIQKNGTKERLPPPPPTSVSRLLAAASSVASTDPTAVPEAHKSVRAQPIDMTTFAPAKFANKDKEQQLLIETTVENNFVFSEFRRSGGKARMESTLETLMDAFEPIEAKVGENILSSLDTTTSKSEEEEHFYIVQEGQVDIEVDGVVVGQAVKGDCFGEQALLHQNFVARNTTLKAASGGEAQGGGSDGSGVTRLLRLDHKSFRGIMQSHATQALDTKRKIIQGIDFLKPLLEQDEDDQLLNQLSSLLTRQEFLQGEEFTYDKDASFHIVQVGKLQVTNTFGDRNMDLGPGEYYGERALLGMVVGDATGGGQITMKGLSPESAGVFYTIARDAMERALGENRLAQLQDLNAFSQAASLQGIMGLKENDSSSKKKKKNVTRRKRKGVNYRSADKTKGLLADRIRRKRFDEQGQDIIQHESEDDPAVYVVREGEVLVKYTDSSGQALQKTVGVGEVFGDEHISNDAKKQTLARPSGYSAEVSGGGPVSVGVLSIKEMQSFEDSSQSTIVEGEEVSEDAENASLLELTTESLQLQQKIREAIKANIGLADLEKISVLGEGQYGEVWLVETDAFQTGVDSLKQRFALKSQFKEDDTRGEEALEAIRQEIDILESLTEITPHPGIVNLINTYEEAECIYMLMGLIPGGELWSRIHQEGADGEWTSGMTAESTQFYTYVIADTLGFIHSQNILFRDLKPENIMLDDDGYPVLVDFGFAKRVIEGDKTFTFCGTPNYVAPEIILHSGHDKGVDYWALGVTMYEMFSGQNPFYFDGMDQVTLYDTICREQFYEYSKTPPAELLDLTHQLLQKEPSQRLGSLAGEVKDILNHPWFAKLDIAKIRTKKFVTPWKSHNDSDVAVDEDAMEEIMASFETPPEPAAVLDFAIVTPQASTESVSDDQEGSEGYVSEVEEDVEEDLHEFLSGEAGGTDQWGEGSCSLAGLDDSDDELMVESSSVTAEVEKKTEPVISTKEKAAPPSSKNSPGKTIAVTTVSTPSPGKQGSEVKLEMKRPTAASLKTGTPSERLLFFQSMSAAEPPESNESTESPRRGSRMSEEAIRLAMQNRKAKDNTKKGRRSAVKDHLKGLGLGDSSEITFNLEAEL